MTNVNSQILAAEAALHGDTEHVVHAVALDPLTSAVCTLKEIREMCSEMLEAQRQWLPQFAGKKIAAQADDRHPAGLQARRGPPRPGPGDQPALRQAHPAEDGLMDCVWISPVLYYGKTPQ